MILLGIGILLFCAVVGVVNAKSLTTAFLNDFSFPITNMIVHVLCYIGGVVGLIVFIIGLVQEII